MRRIPIERFWLDHILATAAGVMAVYSIGRSVGSDLLPNTLAIIVLLAGIAGYGLSLVVDESPVAKADGWFFAGAAIFGILQTRTINGMLPEDGFPFAIIAATMMFILLVVGGLFAWSDATLLFTSLPSLVLFGLVGTIDSWRPGLFLFCGLILCIALLYARVHQRIMIRWAEEGGADRRYLHRDVWKWVAGPEYAFAAAGTIILLSFVGAPVVQTSLSGVSDAVRVNVRTQFRNQLPNQRPNQTPPAESPIGSGPVNLSDREIARVQIPRPMYLRRNVYIRYSQRGWSSGQTVGSTPYSFTETGKNLTFRRTNLANLEELTEVEEIPYRFEANLWTGDNIPTPGAVMELDSIKGSPMETNAHSIFYREGGAQTELNSYVLVPREEQITAKAQFPNTDPNSASARPYYDSPTTAKWTDNPLLSRVDMSDYDRLLALQTTIAGTCQYNTQTPKTPEGRDPVAYFMNESKMGYCDLFASAFALEARRMGYPSRYVTGYLMDTSQLQSDGSYSIQEKHSHSWAEVYFEGYGWIPFDATAGAEDVTPKDQQNDPNSFFGQLKTWVTANIGWLGGVLGLGLFAGVWLLTRARGVSMGGSDTNRHIRVVATRFQISMERIVGTPKRFSQTYREFAEIHREQLAPVWSEVGELLPQLERTMFSAAPLPPEAIDAMAVKISALEKVSKQLQKERKRAQRRRNKPA